MGSTLGWMQHLWVVAQRGSVHSLLIRHWEICRGYEEYSIYGCMYSVPFLGYVEFLDLGDYRVEPNLKDGSNTDGSQVQHTVILRRDGGASGEMQQRGSIPSFLSVSLAFPPESCVPLLIHFFRAT